MTGILLCALLLSVPGLSAHGKVEHVEDAKGKVGIEEKLGQKVPMDLRLIGEDGSAVRLGDLIDRPTLLTLTYFQCTGICSPQLKSVVDLLNGIRLEPGKDFRVLSVSFDKKDTPKIARLQKESQIKQVRRGVLPDSWRFLTGKPEATRRLVDAVGFDFIPYKKDFVHPAVLIVLSPEGTITRYMYGLSYLPSDVQMAVWEANKELARPTISKVLRYCYTYDPGSRTQVFRLTRVAGTVILATAGIFVGFLVVTGRKRDDKV
ncbi:MAG: SCO family protein [Elusimicrobiota bacterium]